VVEISINAGNSQERVTYNIVDKAKYEQKDIPFYLYSIKYKHPEKVSHKLSDLNEAYTLFHVPFF
jgi:hypothetical protein